MISNLDGKTLVIERSGKIKRLKPGQYLVDQSTPRGEDADLYEVKPYGGKRYIDRVRERARWEPAA